MGWATHRRQLTVVCGTKLGSNALVRDAFKGGQPVPVVRGVTGDEVGMLRVAAGCDTGVSVSVEPAGAADIVNVAPAADGKAAAVVLRPKGRVLFDVVETARSNRRAPSGHTR